MNRKFRLLSNLFTGQLIQILFCRKQILWVSPDDQILIFIIKRDVLSCIVIQKNVCIIYYDQLSLCAPDNPVCF